MFFIASLRMAGIALCFLTSIVIIPILPKSKKLLFTRRMCRLICKISGVRLIVSTPIEKIPLRNTLCLANHVNYMDPLLIGSIIPTNFLSKAEVRNWPLIGLAGRMMQQIFVDRASLQSRVKCLFQIRDRLDRENICLFPEGTTTRGPHLAEELWSAGNVWAATFNKSFYLCTGIAFADQDILAWVDDMDFVTHLWKILRRKNTIACLSFELIEHQTEFLKNRRLAATHFAKVTAQLCKKSHEIIKSVETKNYETDKNKETICNRHTYLHQP